MADGRNLERGAGPPDDPHLGDDVVGLVLGGWMRPRRAALATHLLRCAACRTRVRRAGDDRHRPAARRPRECSRRSASTSGSWRGWRRSDEPGGPGRRCGGGDGSPRGGGPGRRCWYRSVCGRSPGVTGAGSSARLATLRLTVTAHRSARCRSPTSTAGTMAVVALVAAPTGCRILPDAPRRRHERGLRGVAGRQRGMDRAAPTVMSPPSRSSRPAPTRSGPRPSPH